MHKKTLLIISGGAEAVPGIQHAKAMGLHVVVSDYAPDAPGFKYADDSLLASTYDIAETIEAARQYHQNRRQIDGVICMAADVPLTVASVADELGLPGISIESARLAADKLAMKQCFVDKGVPVPWFSPVESFEEIKRLMAEQGSNLIIKPVDSRGARGVLRLNTDIDLEWAFNHAQSQSPTGRVMVEEYLAGPQVSTESVMVEGKGYTAGFADRNYEFLDHFAPYIIENGGEQPSRLGADQQAAIKAQAEKAALAMGITNGIAKGDMVLTDDGPKVIEIAARLSGGWFSSDQVPLATGVDLISAAIELALGQTPNLERLRPQYQKGVAIRYFFPSPGQVKAIYNDEQFNGQPWVHRLGFFVKPGDVLEPVTDHTRRAGFVITVGHDRDEAVARAEQVINGVVVEANG